MVLTKLKQHTATKPQNTGTVAPPSVDVVNTCHEMLSERYDDRMGGFGKAPKFPQPSKELKATIGNCICVEIATQCTEEQFHLCIF